jgi:hypothetical protein
MYERGGHTTLTRRLQICHVRAPQSERALLLALRTCALMLVRRAAPAEQTDCCRRHRSRMRSTRIGLQPTREPRADSFFSFFGIRKTTESRRHGKGTGEEPSGSTLSQGENLAFPWRGFVFASAFNGISPTRPRMLAAHIGSLPCACRRHAPTSRARLTSKLHDKRSAA